MSAGGRGGLGGVGSRREARERALTLLYEAASRKVNPAEALETLVVAPDDYVADVVGGVGDHVEDLDAEIDRAASGWSIQRMPVIDVCVLRMGLWELTHRPDVPATAAITEAVALASQFSTDRSARFVNGVLARLARELRPGEATPEPADLPLEESAPPPSELPDLATVTDETLQPMESSVSIAATTADTVSSSGAAAPADAGDSLPSWSGPFELPTLALGDQLVSLRPWRASDAPALARAWADPAVIESTSVPPDSSEDYARRWIEGDAGRRAAGLSLDLVMVATGDDSEVLGEVGLVPTTVANTLELGWWVGADHRGQGLASHAVSLLARWAEHTFGATITASIPADNASSVSVATKAGFIRDGGAAQPNAWRLQPL